LLSGSEHTTGGGTKRASRLGGCRTGKLDTCSSSAVAAGARVTPVKKIKTRMEMLIHNQLNVNMDWQINNLDLAKTLEAKSLCLVRDGESFDVVRKIW
jgi:hypothetical protein